MKKALVLFSGGLDSTTCLAIAKSQGFNCYALSFDYGQRHKAELDAAKRIAKKMGVVAHQIFPLQLNQFGGSALTEQAIPIPTEVDPAAIPITYVPARNIIFLSIALGYAEVIGADDIFIGVSAVDYSNYPDCRPEFIEAFQGLAAVATKAGIEGHPITIHTPLIHLSKAETILLGCQLGIDYRDTVSCYQLTNDARACGVCPSCLLRKKGFKDAGIDDRTNY